MAIPEEIRFRMSASDPGLAHALNCAIGSGFSLPCDGRLAREHFRFLAESGDPAAQTAYSVLLSLGLFGEANVDLAISYCRKAVEIRYPPAMVVLSGYMESGLYRDRQGNESVIGLLRVAADADYAPAIRMLAIMIMAGDYKGPDFNMAYALFRKAAELGDAYSQFMLGMELLSSHDLAVRREAIAWLQRAADQGRPDAHHVLAMHYESDACGFPKDIDRALHHREQMERLEAELGREFLG